MLPALTSGEIWIEHQVAPSWLGAHSVFATDIDGDGDTDIIGASNSHGRITWWENIDGNGTAWADHPLDEEFYAAKSVYAVDLDSDGDTDVLGAGNNTIKWWRNMDGAGTEWVELTVDEEFFTAYSVFAEDVDGDGDIDILGASKDDDDITWWENVTGGGTAWIEHIVDGEFDAPYSVYASDIDGDGDSDVLGAALYASEISWWENSDGVGTIWTEHQVDDNYDGARSVYASDVDSDGDTDILGAASYSNQITWWENLAGTGTEWIEHTISNNFDYARSVFAIDLDEDGDTDVLGAAMDSYEIAWWENEDGLGLDWTEHTIDSFVYFASCVYATDVDGDGDPDVLGASESTWGFISWWEREPVVVDILSPNGGEQWPQSSTQAIAWTSETRTPITIELLQNEVVVDTIASSVWNSGQYNWTVYDSLGEGYTIRLSSIYQEIHYTDESDAPFSIIFPDVQFEVMESDTVHPSFISVIFRATNLDDYGITFLGDLDYYEILEDDDPISEDESLPIIGQYETLPFEQKTVLMLDNSFSIGLDLPFVKEAAKTAIRNQFLNQQHAVWIFSETITEVQPFTSDTTALINAIESITLGPPSTNLYGAVIEGANQWEDVNSLDGIVQGTLVLLTDGEDTQGPPLSSTLQEALDAVQNKEVITIGVGPDADVDVLQQLGTAGYYQANEFEQLNQVFAQVQQQMENFANSFYWLVYISPTRGDNDHTLDVSIPENPYGGAGSMMTVSFSSSGFSSVDPGVYVNRDFNRLLGIHSLEFTDDLQEFDLHAETLFNLVDPYFTWVSDDPQYVSVVDMWGSYNEFATIELGTDEEFSTILTVTDTENEHVTEIEISYTASEVSAKRDVLPNEYELLPVYPNPFNPSATITITMPFTGELEVSVYNIAGQRVQQLVKDTLAAGKHNFTMDGSNLASGLYFVQATVPGHLEEVQKVILVR